MPSLPRDLFLKYTKELGLSEYDAYNLTDSKSIALYFEDLIKQTKLYKLAANWMMGDIKSYLNAQGKEISDFPINPKQIAALIELINEGKISSSIASQKIFPAMLETPSADPLKLAESMNLIQDSNEDSILGFIDEVKKQHPDEVARYKNGEKQLVGFLMGQLMKISKGKADPKTANQILRNELEK